MAGRWRRSTASPSELSSDASHSLGQLRATGGSAEFGLDAGAYSSHISQQEISAKHLHAAGICLTESLAVAARGWYR